MRRAGAGPRRASGGERPDVRVVVFMAQFGDADPVMPPGEVVAGWDYVVFCSDEVRPPRPWTVRVVSPPSSADTPRLQNRWCKLHASTLLPDYDVSIYVDTHVQIVGDLRVLLDEFLASDADCGLIRHPISRNVAHEVKRQVRVGRITPSDFAANWTAQQARQARAGFRDDLGLYFAAVVLRRHDRPQVAEFEEAWWVELRSGVTRDQVALPFALWTTDIRYQAFLLPWPLRPYFRTWQHLPRGNRHRRLIRQLDCRVATMPWLRWPLLMLRPRAALRSLRRRGRRVDDHSGADRGSIRGHIVTLGSSGDDAVRRESRLPRDPATR